MLQLIPVVGPILAKILCVPMNWILNQPAEMAVTIGKVACNAVIGGCS